jgi:hypothetical protein
MARVKIDDPEAAHYPFTFQKGDNVARQNDKSLDPGTIGEIVDGEFEGSQSGSYTLIYTVKTFKEGSYYGAKDLGLEKVD